MLAFIPDDDGNNSSICKHISEEETLLRPKEETLLTRIKKKPYEPLKKKPY